MDNRLVIEENVSRFIEQYHDEWDVVCGYQEVPTEDMWKIIKLLGKKKLYELEAMMIWRMEQIETNRFDDDNGIE